MPFSESGPTMTAVGSTAAVAGAVVAQASSSDMGNAALFVGLSGVITALVGGITQLFKIWLDSRNYADKIKQLEAKVLDGSQKRHADRSKFQGLFMQQEAQLMEANDKVKKAETKATEAQIRMARLEGQLGVIDKTHAENINANTKNIDVVAEQAGVQLPVHPPPVEPIVPPKLDVNHDILDPSDDDITLFFHP